MSQADVVPAPDLGLSSQPSGKWERERAAYWRLLPSLFSQYHDQYVAIHEGQVVDSGVDQVELALRVYRRLGYTPIYVGRVYEQPPPILRVPSPRLLGEAVA